MSRCALACRAVLSLLSVPDLGGTLLQRLRVLALVAKESVKRSSISVSRCASRLSARPALSASTCLTSPSVP